MSAPKRSRSRSRTHAAPRGRRTGKQNKAFNSSPAKEDFCHRPIARCRWRRSMLDARTTFARNSLSHTGERACTVARPARSSSMLRPYAAAADTDVQNRTLPPRGPRHRNVNNSEHTRCRHTSVAEGICVQPQSGRRSRPFSEQRVLTSVLKETKKAATSGAGPPEALSARRSGAASRRVGSSSLAVCEICIHASAIWQTSQIGL